ncbi:MAG TPA: thioredoxin domain-containing protein [Longimicrobium sp.]|nr:thioredoxin domain-containing protein [Longimicrobium sp.]
MKERLLNIATVLVAACCVAVIGMAVWNSFESPAPAAAASAFRQVENWQPAAAGGRLIGPADARVRVVVFSDFECAGCGRAAEALRVLQQRWPDDVALVFRHYPLESIHPNAVPAALAAECAAEQGRFEAYHDALFARREQLGTVDWAALAREVGVPDADEFGRCVAEERHFDRVGQDVAAGDAIGIQGTPTIVVEGRVAVGGSSGAQVQAWVQEALARGGAR